MTDYDQLLARAERHIDHLRRWDYLKSADLMDELADALRAALIEIAELQRSYDEEHHGMGVEGSDFHEYGGTYHDKDGNPIAAGSATPEDDQ
jgi:hypothetical protein